MQFKDTTKMTNAEIRVYQETLNNEFERIKRDILNNMTKLNELDREWIRVQKEVDGRKIKI